MAPSLEPQAQTCQISQRNIGAHSRRSTHNRKIYRTAVNGFAGVMYPRETVYRLELLPNSFRHNIPAYVTTIIIKQQKEDWEEEFAREIQAYNKLYLLQGTSIPTLYGQGFFNGIPALILSDIREGKTLHYIAKHTDISEELVEKRLYETLKRMHEHGVQQRDQKLDNFLFGGHDNDHSYGGGNVVAVDLEDVLFSGECRYPTDRCIWDESFIQAGVRSLMEELRYVRDPKRPPSTLRFWMVRNGDTTIS